MTGWLPLCQVHWDFACFSQVQPDLQTVIFSSPINYVKVVVLDEKGCAAMQDGEKLCSNILQVKLTSAQFVIVLKTVRQIR